MPGFSFVLYSCPGQVLRPGLSPCKANWMFVCAKETENGLVDFRIPSDYSGSYSPGSGTACREGASFVLDFGSLSSMEGRALIKCPMNIFSTKPGIEVSRAGNKRIDRNTLNNWVPIFKYRYAKKQFQMLRP